MAENTERPAGTGALTIPARKPIKAPYIRDFVQQVDAHIKCMAEAKGEEGS